MTFRKICAGLMALAAAAGCTPEEQQAAQDVIAAQELIYNRIVSDAALNGGYNGRTSFSDIRWQAQNIVNNDPRFRFQRRVRPGGFVHYALSSANVEYAHQLNLKGSNQTIAIVDSGFRRTHDVFTGKAPGSVNLAAGSSTNSGNHGTYVASIAAGNSAQMVGVAPDANLLLGTNNGNDQRYQVTQAAIAAGAIAQNNSWGLSYADGTEYAATQQDYDAAFSSTSGQNYISSLTSFSNSGIVVFAASNDSGRTSADLMAALPEFVSGLEKGFLAVINVAPQMSGDDVVGGYRLSAACLEAARYCLGADGSTQGANNNSNSAYSTGTGTSYAAPQVSGAIAILAQAFPSLTNEELRARLLASADNSWFSHDGYVNFSSSVKHGFNSEFGHGFLDLEAALLPIGSSYMRSASGREVPVDRPTLVSMGASGDALSRALGNIDIQFSDGLGAGFDAKANFLAAHAIPKVDPVGFTYDLLDQSYEVAALGDGFGNYLGGERRSLDTGAIEVTYLAPGHGFAGQDVGVDVKFDQGQGVTYSLTAAVEGDTFVGISSTAGKGTGAMHGAAGIGWSGEIAPRLDLALGARIGVAAPLNTGNDLTRFSTAAYDELGMQLVARDVSALGDRLAFRMALPQAVTGGQATFTLPNARGSGAGFRNVGVDLAPTARQLDIGLDYSLPTGNGGAFILSAGHKLNHGHVAGQNSTSVGFGWKIEF